MDKGIKSIAHTDGKLLKAPDKANYLVVAPEVRHRFEIAEWFDEEAEPQHISVIWRLRMTRKNSILKTCYKKGSDGVVLKLTRKLCGLARFYLEAAQKDQTNPNLAAGLYIIGYTKPVIKKSYWARTKNGTEFKEQLKYGEIIFLHVETEGLNGNALVAEVYFCTPAGEADLMVSSYASVDCINGEFDLRITNTLTWYAQMDDPVPESAVFVAKIKDADRSDIYYADEAGSILHARSLNIENKINEEKAVEDINTTFEGS